MNRRKILKFFSLLPAASLIGLEGNCSKLLTSGRSDLSWKRLDISGRMEPEVFVLGDSISIHYGPFLQQFIEAFAKYCRKGDETISGVKVGSNGGNSRNILDYLQLKLTDRAFSPDYMLLNCGLHDVKRFNTNNELQVSLEEYKQNLRQIFSMLQKRNISIIWIRTTPVIDSIHNTRRNDFKRYAIDVASFNTVADQLCEERGIPAIDLHTFTSRLPELPESKYIDNVHFNAATRMLQASYISGFLQFYLQTQKQT